MSNRDVAALAATLSQPAVLLKSQASPARSHFGGSPQLPNGVPWPRSNGKPMLFLARVSLTELATVHRIDWLPDHGALLFFYDEDQSAWGFDPQDRSARAVLHVPDVPADSDQRSAAPLAGSTLAYRSLGFLQVQRLPSTEREVVEALQLTDAESDVYYELLAAPFGGGPRHQVAGFPMPIQSDGMELECQLASHGIYCGDSSGYNTERARELAPGAANWRLLLQLDTDDELEIMWGDVGTIYFWVEEQAARAGHFDNVWLILQCH